MKKFLTRKRIVILVIVAIAGVLAGRFAVRIFMNLLLGGSLFGGDF